MVPMYNINDALLNHVTVGAGQAILQSKNSIYQHSFRNTSRWKYEDFISYLKIFFDARTDVRRLIYSQKIATIILESRNMKELTSIRKAVAKMELSRVITHKHRDHTSHTLYLFLFGIWLYDTIPKIRESFTSKINKQKKHVYHEWYVAHPGLSI
jgi:hypothetical protein